MCGWFEHERSLTEGWNTPLSESLGGCFFYFCAYFDYTYFFFSVSNLAPDEPTNTKWSKSTVRDTYGRSIHHFLVAFIMKKKTLKNKSWNKAKTFVCLTQKEKFAYHKWETALKANRKICQICSSTVDKIVLLFNQEGQEIKNKKSASVRSVSNSNIQVHVQTLLYVIPFLHHHNYW